jgi:hypothetical protein
MRIAIISDTHGNVKNFKRIVDWLNKEGISMILHCGDIGDPDSLKESLIDFNGNFFGVLGNMDVDYAIDIEKYQDYPKIKVSESVFDIEIDGKKIAIVHFPEIAEKLAESGNYDIVFYGHTHKPFKHKMNNCYLINPGNVAGIYYKPTFAVYDSKNDKLELKILEKL